MNHAKTNVFNALMKVYSDVATRPGTSSGKMIEVVRDGGHVALEHPESQRQRPDDVDDDEARQGVDEPDHLQHDEDRDDDEDERNDLGDEDPSDRPVPDGTAVAGDRVGGGERD